jgi:hypothetical protein
MTPNWKNLFANNLLSNSYSSPLLLCLSSTFMYVTILVLRMWLLLGPLVIKKISTTVTINLPLNLCLLFSVFCTEYVPPLCFRWGKSMGTATYFIVFRAQNNKSRKVQYYNSSTTISSHNKITAVSGFSKPSPPPRSPISWFCGSAVSVCYTV